MNEYINLSHSVDIAAKQECEDKNVRKLEDTVGGFIQLRLCLGHAQVYLASILGMILLLCFL